MKIKNKTIKFISLFVAVICLFASVSVSAAQQEVTGENKIQAVIDLLAQLPVDAESVTADDVDFILETKEAYNALTAEERLEVPIESITLLNQVHPAVMPFLLERVTSTIKELPEAKKLKDSDKQQVVDLYESYLALDEELKDAMSEKHQEKLLSAVKKVAPELLGEQDAGDEAASQEENTKSIDYIKIWQIVLIALVSVIVVCGLVVMILLIIRFLQLGDA